MPNLSQTYYMNQERLTAYTAHQFSNNDILF